MKSAALILTAVFGSASAFAPSSVARTNTAVSAFADGMVGGEGPEPMPFTTSKTSKNWDPAGFTEVCYTVLIVSEHEEKGFSYIFTIKIYDSSETVYVQV